MNKYISIILLTCSLICTTAMADKGACYIRTVFAGVEPVDHTGCYPNLSTKQCRALRDQLAKKYWYALAVVFIGVSDGKPCVDIN